jgi:16S rRNA (cytidine1402-2'-O)-methyltransferase
VATPIGNLADMTSRGRDVLATADLVLCEDSRVTSKLLQALALRRSLQLYHEHNAERMRPKVLEALAGGQTVALVSDAGTPLLSDPGFKLVRAARDAGHRVVPVPGPAAALAALTASGLPTDRFFFQGFLPTKAAARTRAIAELARIPATLVIFESALRVEATLAALADGLGDREAVLAREITKRFEEFRSGRLRALAEGCRVDPPRGEIVLVVDGGQEAAAGATDAELDAALLEALAAASPSEAARRVAAATGRAKREVYARAMALKGS